MVTDGIGDTLIQIKNAYMARHSEVEVSNSKVKEALLAVLKKLGYVAKVEKNDERMLRIELKYIDGAPALTEVKRISKPGLRRYAGVKELHKLSQGLGYVILSTPKGLMTHVEAKKQNLGGEILCKVW